MMVVVVGLAVPAVASAQYGSGALTVSPSTLAAGQSLTASGAGYAASSPVTVTFTSDPVVLANITTTAAGSFSINVTVPTNATAGQHTLSASGKAPDNSARLLTASLNIVASGAPPLVRTGSSDVGTLLLWGTLLIVLGSVAVLAVRRNQFRRQRSSWS